VTQSQQDEEIITMAIITNLGRMWSKFREAKNIKIAPAISSL
jgi:hypothetical protein